ncbi:endonuclease/exonuclease/phosphatase family protein [Haloactinopolyspora alba]|uniref:endonuclease/exonuclease/phosphatase family protein n=1 Tax=Haloactinopolyspora alba TaxID=648780 RepID=UPI003B84B0FB
MVIATWNLENLFLPGEGSGHPPDRATYDAKLDALASTVEGAGAVDVLAVQEVGDAEAATDLAARLGESWTVHLSQHPDPRGIRVGVLSTRPITETEDVAEFPAELGGVRSSDDGETTTRMRRGAFRARFDTDAGPVDVVTCHLKSKLLTYPGGRFWPRSEGERARYGAYALYQRAAEATTVRSWANRIIDGEGQQRSVVVCGDLNDEVRAATTQILLGPGGSEIGTPGEERPDQGDAWRLWNTAPLIPQERRYSRIYRGRRELIDHVLVSHELLQHVDEVDSLVDRALPSVDDTPTARAQATHSDHAPVVARFGIG